MRAAAAVRVAFAVLTLAAVLLTAAPAAAHTVLTGSDPAADTTLDAGPARVTATFNEDLQPTFAAVTVVGPDGNLWSQGDTVVQGPTASVGVRPLGPSGRYTVNYRVTSNDGHVVSGSWSFTVQVAGTGTPGPAAATPSHNSIPLWPFIIGLAALIAGAIAWGLRRKS